ncbi:hypothetical protein [Novosphingobium sp. CCH12-A3]|uniref:hypothetical protein n=1 Tax=Novosphingobium sp. CCH12-A3 TaxID=1768752 RepID=UPI000783D11F|nr:hypothetical protein [Novosphingobium sp. CCH12-A3]
MSGEDLMIFCRQPVVVGGETFNVVAGLRSDRPGEIIVRTMDDNDYPDDRFPVEIIPAAAGIVLRTGPSFYPWEELMQRAEHRLRGQL